jgi:hypothetical protein
MIKAILMLSFGLGTAYAQERPVLIDPQAQASQAATTKDTETLRAALGGLAGDLTVLRVQIISMLSIFGSSDAPIPVPKTALECREALAKLDGRIHVTQGRVKAVQAEITDTPALLKRLDEKQAALNKAKDLISKIKNSAAYKLNPSSYLSPNDDKKLDDAQKKLDAERSDLKKAPETLAQLQKKLLDLQNQRATFAQLQSKL